MLFRSMCCLFKSQKRMFDVGKVLILGDLFQFFSEGHSVTEKGNHYGEGASLKASAESTTLNLV